MDQNELSAVIAKTAALMEQFERRCADIEQRQQSLTAELRALAQQILAAVRQSADSTLQALPGQLLGKVQSGLEQPVDHYEQRLREAGRLLGEGAQVLAAQIQRLVRLLKHLVWKTLAVTTTCMALLLVGGTWLSAHYYGVIRENQVSGDLLKAYNGADVVLCGDGRLCAKVDASAVRDGSAPQYLPIERRR